MCAASTIGKWVRLSTAAGRKVTPVPANWSPAGHAAGREVLVDQQGVIHLADATHRAQLRMPEVAVLAQDRRIALHGKALLADRGGGVEAHPQRDGVDEQADHGLDAGQFGGPAGHRDTEHDIVAVGQARHDQSPTPSAAAC